MNIKFQNVLVLAPHTDDGELGMGGTIHKLITEGVKVTYVAFSTAAKSVPEGFPKDILKTEVRNATSVLGVKPENLIIFDYEVRKLNYSRQDILENLIKIRKDINPDVIFTPSPHDIHQDHLTIAQEAIRAFKNRTIFGYELIWNNLTFNTQCFVPLDEKCVDKKVEALKEYQSQHGKDYMSREFIYSLAKSRGIQSGNQFAEAFEVIRLFL